MFYINGFLIVFLMTFLSILILVFIQSLLGLSIFFVILIGIAIGFKIFKSENIYSISWLGKDLGIFEQSGFFWILPFSEIKSASLKLQTYTTKQIKTTDILGVPIEISGTIIYQINEPKSFFKNIENHEKFLDTQIQYALHKIIHQYSLIEMRDSFNFMTQRFLLFIQEKVNTFGIKINEASFTYSIVENKQISKNYSEQTKQLENTEYSNSIFFDFLEEYMPNHLLLIDTDNPSPNILKAPKIGNNIVIRMVLSKSECSISISDVRKWCKFKQIKYADFIKSIEMDFHIIRQNGKRELGLHTKYRKNIRINCIVVIIPQSIFIKEE